MEIGEPGGFLVWLTDALDSVVRLGRTYQQDPGTPGGDEDVFESVSPVVAKLMDHEGIAFMTVRPDGVEFDLSYVARPADSARIEIEIRHQISEGTFAWALYHNGPVVVPSASGDQWLLLHVLATPARVWGMFLAVLTPPSSFVPDVSQKLLSLVLSEVAGVLESRLLQRRHAAGTAWLQEMVDARTAALRRSEQAARGSERAKSTFLARMSHEIRTPLNGVIGMASLLLDSELEADQRIQAETIQESAERLLEMMNEILEASSAEADKLTLDCEEFSLRDVVEEVARLHAGAAAAKGIDLIVRYGRAVPDGVVGDAARVSRVISILLDNAVRCTEAGHVLLEVDFGSDDDFVVAVTDTGPGIKAERLDRIFERFGDGDRNSTGDPQGSGLGLSVCKELVSLMGGDIRVQTQFGKGSRFALVLPLPRTEPSNASSYETLAGERVSVVCDRHLVAGVAAEVISDFGGKPAVFSTLNEAQSALGAASSSGSLVLISDDEMKIPSPGDAWSGPRIAFLPATRLLAAGQLSERGYDHVVPLPLSARGLIALLGRRLPRPTQAVRTVGKFSLQMRGRVLVVEDDPINQRVAEMMLRRLRCDVVLAAGGEQALSLVMDEHFDLLVMDCEMPGMDGFQATQAIRAWEHSREQHVPIVALTARTMGADRDAAFRSGMDDFLTKPIRIEDMEALLRQWVPVRAEDGRPVQPQAPHTPKGDVVFDEAAAIRQVCGSQDLLGELVSLFREGWTALRESIPESLAQGDTGPVAAAAHRLKGSASNVGAVLVWDAARRLEEAARAGDKRAAAPLWLALDEEVARFLDAVAHSSALERP